MQACHLNRQVTSCNVAECAADLDLLLQQVVKQVYLILQLQARDVSLEEVRILLLQLLPHLHTVEDDWLAAQKYFRCAMQSDSAPVVTKITAGTSQALQCLLACAVGSHW